MKKTILAIAAAATIAASGLAAPTTAEARDGANALGIGLGVAAGAIVGTAIVNSQPRAYYAPQPGYVVYSGYNRPYPISCPGGYWSRKPVYDRYGNMVRWSQPRFICP